MRLGQLSRKVNVKPTEIVNYLKNEFDVELGTHLNTKVDDALVEKITSKFVSKPIVENDRSNKPEISIVPENKELDGTPSEKIEEPVQEETTTEELDTEEISQEFEVNEEVDAQTISNAPLIKAEKIELTGPKVIGKIELPPPLSEQMVEIDGVMISKEELANRKKEKRNEKREQNLKRRQKRSSESVRKSRIKSEAQLEQIKRDKEAEEMSKKLEIREKRIAALQKEKSKPVTPKYAPKKAKKKTIVKIEESKKLESFTPEPTTWYGKLWKWFNT